MEEQRKPITNLELFLRGNKLPLWTIGFLILTILTAFSNPDPEQIYTGQQFFYGWYIYSDERYSLLRLIGILTFLLLILRSVIIKTVSNKVIVPILFFLPLIFALALLSPSLARPIDSAKFGNDAYNLYYQWSGGNNFTHWYVLVKCDSLSLLCHFAEKWEHKWIRYPQRDASLSTDAVNNTLSVLINGEVVYTHPVE